MKIDGTQPVLRLAVLLLTSIVTQESLADNGALALARPVQQIKVDGDFSDWPSSLPWYSIERGSSGQRPHDANDFEASFRVGYDQHALYVAVQVRDESFVDTVDLNPMSQDSCSIFLDVQHIAERTAPIQFDILGNGSPRRAPGPAAFWSYQRKGPQHCYEMRFDIQRIRPQVKVTPGLVVGLDFIIWDRDSGHQGSTGVSWGPKFRKHGCSDRLGDILLVSPKRQAVQVQGRLLSTGDVPLPLHRVQLKNETQTSSVTIRTDSNGEFEYELPTGDYRVLTMNGEQIGRFRVEANRTPPRLDFRVTTPAAAPAERAQETIIAAGAPPVAAGRGNQIGRWQRFGTEDGLPEGEFRGVAQTSDGAIWIASDQAGLLRFDRKSFTTFDLPMALSCKSVATDHNDTV
jgi:hypothetical protein